MEQQMALFADIEVENVVTGERRKSPLIPLTDAVMTGLFSEDNEGEPIGMIDELLAKSRVYGAQLGRLAYVENKMVESVMDASIISWVDGVNAVHRLDPEEREQLRNAAFVAAFGAAQKTASAC